MRKFKPLIPVLLYILGIILITVYIKTHFLPVLTPKGFVAEQEKSLFAFAAGLSLVVLLPVFFFTIFISMKYREGNTKAEYTPDWDHNLFLDLMKWGIPIVVIAILAVVMWKDAHLLDPHKPLPLAGKPMTIEVVALQWKWLFIYPQENIATLNYVVFPEKTPVTFDLTADAPMNSFWIPQLGGQMYAMSGMVNNLHLYANTVGDYQGSDAEISGRGFAGMKFSAKVTTKKDFDTWVSVVQQSQKTLTFDEYNRLAKPSENTPETSYSMTADGLYNRIIMKYMMPGQNIGLMNNVNY